MKLQGVRKRKEAHHAQMQLFHEAMDACGFINMGFRGCQFTWKKLFRDGNSIWKRLDRSLANSEWLSRFGGSKVHHLNCSTSGHSPLLIIPEPVGSVIPSKPFRFKEMWLIDKGCAQIVKAIWEKRRATNQNSVIVSKIDDCGVALKKMEQQAFWVCPKEAAKKNISYLLRPNWQLSTQVLIFRPEC